MKTIIDLPLQSELLRIFEYRDGGLFWRAKIGDGREIRRWNSRYAGKQAGHPSTKGYLQVKICKHNYMVHRIIFVMINGDVLDKEKQVDHVLSRTDANHHLDLRVASHSQNCAYSKRRVDSTYGKGITFRRGRFEARIQVNGKRMDLGTFKEIELARAAYAAAAARYFGEFARVA